MTREEFVTQYWKYYIMLEREFINTLDYAEIGQDSVYSNKYAMLLQAIGAELDCFFKAYCNKSPEDHSNISDYANFILESWPEIREQKVSIIDKRIIIQPYKGWDKKHAKTSLSWWEGFDDIKHSRTANYSKANQINTVNALAALFIIEMRKLSLICDGKEADIPEQPSSLFDLENWEYRYLPMGEGLASIDGYICMVNTKKISWVFSKK